MQTHTTPVEMTTKFGKLWLAVGTADESSHHETGKGNVTVVSPVLWLASDPGFTGESSAMEHWTIRGRRYGVHSHLFYQRGQWFRSRNQPYRGGFRNDMQNTVEFGTKTWDLMWDTVIGVADQFADRHPRWGQLSTFLLHRRDASSAEGRVLAARKEAEKAEAEAAELRKRQTGTRAVLSPELRDMIIPENG